MKIEYIRNLIDILVKAGANELAQSLIAKLEQLKALLEQFEAYVNIDETIIDALEQYQELIDQIIDLINGYLSERANDDAYAFAVALMAGDLDENSSQAQLVKAACAITSKPDDYIQSLLNKANEDLSKSGSNRDVVIKGLSDDISNLINSALNIIQFFSQDLYDSIDGDGIRMYDYINNMVINNDWGFDLFRTSDGVDFEVITRNGFNDKYNYGCPAFLATEEGLYIGTCNPFYGGQLYLLTNTENTAIQDISADKQNDSQSNVYYTLTGVRINGVPSVPGIYINNGRKVVIK